MATTRTKKPRAKKSANTKTRSTSSSASAPPKVNKAKWIRNQPASMLAKDVVAKAKGEGITLSLAQVYTTRTAARKAAKKPPSKDVSIKKTALRSPAGAPNDETAFRHLVLTIGLTRAESYLSSLKRSVGL